MASRKEDMLDGDWLLGEESPRTNHGLWLMMVLFLSISGFVVWTWPTLSRWYLQRQYFEQALQAKNLEEAAPGLVGLKSLMPASARSLIACLCHPDDAVSRYASEALHEYVADLTDTPAEKRRAVTQWLAATLQKPETQPNESQQQRIFSLAVRLRELCRQDEHPTSQLALQRLNTLFGWSEELITPRVDSIPHYQSSGQPGIVRPVDVSLASTANPLTNTSIATNPLAPSPAPFNQLESIPLTQQTRVSLSDTPTETSPVRLSDLGAPSQSAPVVLSLSDNEPEAMPEVSPSSVAPPIVSAQSMLARQDRKDPPSPTPVASIENPIQETVYSAKNAEYSANHYPMPSGLDQLGADQVVRLLASVQPHMANAAVRELERRQWNPKQLEMAIDLAQGSTRQRLEAMERLIHNGEFQPIPWLTWMAEVGDREVRKQAVVLLGSIADENAQRQLRLLKNREQDGEVREQIHRILISAGNNSSLQRR